MIGAGEGRSLRYLWVYPAYSPGRVAEEEEFVERVRAWGFSIETFGVPCPGGWWPFPELDARWRARAPDLMAAYEQLAAAIGRADALIAAGGSMLHPEFLAQFDVHKTFVCSDDPEASEILSRPVAPAFDRCFVLNIACLDDYRSWGCRRVEWLFHGVRPEMADPTLTEAAILDGHRDVDVAMFCERELGLSDRAVRLERLAERFPQAVIRGRGWPGGFVTDAEMRATYARTKIGWNLHNSIGPCNTRLFMLPAFGVLQICDNAARLGEIFALDREVVGFETLDECLAKTEYYLTHDRDRREIAARGWRRVTTEYTEERQWATIAERIAADVGAAVVAPSAPQAVPQVVPQGGGGERPRVVLLADRRGWAYDHEARAMVEHLSGAFDLRIAYVEEQPDLSAEPFDLLYVFFWGETYHQRFVSDPRRVIKQVSSHRWANEAGYGFLTPAEFVERHLGDAATVTVISRRLQKILAPLRSVRWAPQGFAPDRFAAVDARSGGLRVGWAGNAGDACKGLDDVLRPAAGTDFDLRIADGSRSLDEMADFYRSIDVICVASTAEGGPLPLLEAMACGCFPVTVDVGIAPELVRHGETGLIVERSVDAFRAAFQWCARNLEHVRSVGAENTAALLRQRTWARVATRRAEAMWAALVPFGWQRPEPQRSEPQRRAPVAAAKPSAVDELKGDYRAHLQGVNPAGAGDATFRAASVYYTAEILPVLPAGRDGRFLEVGCGFGHLLRFLREHGYGSLEGVDLDAELAAAAQANAGVPVHHADAIGFLEQAVGTYDVIAALDILEHFTLDGALRLARAMRRALRPGGRAIIRTPNMANLLGVYSRYMDLTHQTGFTEQSLAQLLRAAGFATTELHIAELDPAEPLAAKLAESRAFHRKLFELQDRSMPRCVDKNIVVYGVAPALVEVAR